MKVTPEEASDALQAATSTAARVVGGRLLRRSDLDALFRQAQELVARN